MNEKLDIEEPVWILPTFIPPYAIDIKRTQQYSFREDNTPIHFWRYRTSPHTKHYECNIESAWYYERYVPPF